MAKQNSNDKRLICWSVHNFIIDHFDTVLFSAFKQTCCAHVACDLEWVAVYFYRTFFNIHWSDVLTTLFGLLHGHAKLLQSWCKFCVHYTTMHQFTVSLSWIHIPRVYVCLVVTCHLHFGQNKQALLHATVVTQGWNGYRNGHQHEQNVYHEEEHSYATPAGTQPKTFWSGVWHSTTELFLLPLSCPSHYKL